CVRKRQLCELGAPPSEEPNSLSSRDRVRSKAAIRHSPSRKQYSKAERASFVAALGNHGRPRTHFKVSVRKGWKSLPRSARRLDSRLSPKHWKSLTWVSSNSMATSSKSALETCRTFRSSGELADRNCRSC